MKQKTTQFTSILAFFLFLFINPVFSQHLNDSLLVYYPFNGDSVDYSGNEYNPVLFRASYATDRNGIEENALYFNGIDDLIIMPDKTSLRPPFPITIAFWIKLDNLTPENGIFFTNDFFMNIHSGVWLN